MEDACTPVLNTGLRGITIASTKISDVNGAEGKLVYRGYLARDLAGNTSFEEVVYLLLYEKLPDRDQLKAFKRQIAEQREVPEQIVAAMKAMPKDALPMDVLQAAVPMLAAYDPDIHARMDGRRAVQWVRAHADDYGIDPNRVAMIGFSAGAAVTGTSGSELRNIRP